MAGVSCAKTSVIIEKLRIGCFVGAGDVERAAKQPVFVDIKCDLMHPDVRKDDLALTLNYAALAKQVRALALSNNWRLLETLAREIAVICFKDKKVRRAIVTLRKPNKFSDVEAVGVTCVFYRKRRR